MTCLACKCSSQRVHGRNANLAAADVEAAQARVDALHYRLDGKSAQAAVTKPIECD